jgi:hypothetical protein
VNGDVTATAQNGNNSNSQATGLYDTQNTYLNNDLTVTQSFEATISGNVTGSATGGSYTTGRGIYIYQMRIPLKKLSLLYLRKQL